MKKTAFLFLLPIILSGCGNNNLPPIIEQTKSFETTLPLDTWSYPAPETNITVWTWVILAEINSKIQNEVSYTSTQEEKQNGRKESIVTGYIYTYIYQDLWLKIISSALYAPYFFELAKEPILKKNNNMIYFSKWNEYIQMFRKDSSTPLKKILEEKHLATWCVVLPHFTDPQYDQRDKREKKRPWIDINNFFDISWLEWASWTDIQCRSDKEYPDSYLSTFFVQSRYYKDRYYKISMWDACAPGPCTIFWKIEFF